MKRKLEYTETEYIHHGCISTTQGKLETFEKIESIATEMMAKVFINGEDEKAEGLRELIRRLQMEKATESDTITYLRKVGSRIEASKR